MHASLPYTPHRTLDEQIRAAWLLGDTATTQRLEQAENEALDAWCGERSELVEKIDTLQAELDDLRTSSGVIEAARKIKAREANARAELSQAHGQLLRELVYCLQSGAMKRKPARSNLANYIGARILHNSTRPADDASTINAQAVRVAEFRRAVLGAGS